MLRELTQAILEVLEGGRRGALATVIKASGSTPQQPGARLLLTPDGRQVGTVGGGAIEQAIRGELERCLADGRPRYVTHDLGPDLGMCCGGHMEVFVEPIEALQRLFVFGAGHVARPTAALARSVGFAVTVIDDREELNTEERFPGCRRVVAEPAEAAAELGLTELDWVLVVTRDHRLDEEALDACVHLPHRYIGLIGSRRKIVKILQRIEARRGALPALDRVWAPVGLDVGAVTPEEIAVSIVGELVALRHDAPGGHLRAIDDPVIARALAGREGASAEPTPEPGTQPAPPAGVRESGAS